MAEAVAPTKVSRSVCCFALTVLHHRLVLAVIYCDISYLLKEGLSDSLKLLGLPPMSMSSSL